MRSLENVTTLTGIYNQLMSCLYTQVDPLREDRGEEERKVGNKNCKCSLLLLLMLSLSFNIFFHFCIICFLFFIHHLLHLLIIAHCLLSKEDDEAGKSKCQGELDQIETSIEGKDGNDEKGVEEAGEQAPQYLQVGFRRRCASGCRWWGNSR